MELTVPKADFVNFLKAARTTSLADFNQAMTVYRQEAVTEFDVAKAAAQAGNAFNACLSAVKPDDPAPEFARLVDKVKDLQVGDIVLVKLGGIKFQLRMK